MLRPSYVFSRKEETRRRKEETRRRKNCLVRLEHVGHQNYPTLSGLFRSWGLALLTEGEGIPVTAHSWLSCSNTTEHSGEWSWTICRREICERSLARVGD
jgi:hypothetical protein